MQLPEDELHELLYFGHEVVVIDSNDLSCEILGKSNAKLKDNLLKQIFSDNPLGQGRQQTPIAIARRIADALE